MIFGNNTTGLGELTIPMAEGYDCEFGAAKALYEAAVNEGKMFQAMIMSDMHEAALLRNGALQESAEITSIREAAISGIWTKIKELFSKLAAKIKAIFGAFMAKLTSLFMKDKDAAKKYQNQILRRENINSLEVKWCKVKNNPLTDSLADPGAGFSVEKAADGYKEDREDRLAHFLPSGVEMKDYSTHLDEYFFDDKDDVKLSEIGGAAAVIKYMLENEKQAKTLKTASDKLVKDLAKYVKDCDKKIADSMKTKVTTDSSDEAIEAAKKETDDATHGYEMALAYQTVKLAQVAGIQAAVRKQHAQYKAAFVKCLGSGKIEESMLIAMAEAAEEEVTDVLVGAIEDETISDISAAPTTVKDADVSDCPNTLTYGPDKYTTDANMDDADGTIDTCVDSKIGGKSEAAFFGKLLY